MNATKIGNKLDENSGTYKFLKGVYRFFIKNKRNQMMYSMLDIDGGLVNENKKILIIAPHPDDEVIGCGGIIAKYGKQTDVLCINSSGVKYEWDKLSPEEIADVRIDEFNSVMKLAGVNKYKIARIWGIPPMFNQIKKNMDNYMQWMDWKQYDVIFVPYKYDGHREHRFVGNYLIPHILKTVKHKDNLLIARYEVWSSMQAPNYFEDISEYIIKKQELIDGYVTRKNGRYTECITGLNCYRGILAKCNYAEAFYVQSVKQYLRERDDRSWNK